MKKIIILFLTCAGIFPANAQFLKKLKEKVNKTVDNASDIGNKSTNAGASANTNPKDPKTKINWCDTIAAADNYTLAYSSPEKFILLYDESRLGIGRNKSEYRLILKQSVDNKTQFVIIDNGKIITTVSSLADDQIIGGVHEPLDGLNGGFNTKTEKYVIADSTTVIVPGTASKTVAAPKPINEDQVNRAYEMMKKTDEYKKMSAEEKKELEESMKQTPEMVKVLNSNRTENNTITIDGVKGGTYTKASGFYSVIIKGKSYGRFSGRPVVNVSADESNVYIVGSDDKGKACFISNDKRIPIVSKAAGYIGYSGNIIISPDGKKAVFIELKNLTEKETEEQLKYMQSSGKVKNTYIVTKNDGTAYQLTRTDGGDKYRLTNSGALVYLNLETREVFSDAKSLGKFNGSAYPGIIADGLLIGSNPANICYYMDDGSLTYMDGSQKQTGILFPQVITDDGKTYLTWFRKCKHDIYIGKLEF